MNSSLAARLALTIPMLMIGSQWAVARNGQGTCFGRAVLLHPYDAYYLVTMLSLAVASLCCGAFALWKGQSKWLGGIGILLATVSVLMPVGLP